MPDVTFKPLPTEIVRAYQNGATDANGLPPERAVSEGAGNPCRHCLTYIPEGAPMLILAHRPFDAPQPYAETGPIFVCAERCEAWDGDGLPPMFKPAAAEARLLKGYSPEDRIVYGLGRIVPPGEIPEAAEDMLADPRVAYVHVRSSTNNCYSCRIDRDMPG
ncbi:MAG: DUF1203 domain-containing protein [Pseudomonadota bacterium]